MISWFSPSSAGMPALRTPELTRELLGRLRPYPVYGLLLTPDADKPFTKLITTQWDRLNEMTGENLLLLAFQPPDTFSQEFKGFWKKELGEDFYEIWGKLEESKTKAHHAYNFDKMFVGKRICRTEMPCLALFTTLDAERAVVLRIPDWSNDDLWEYLKAVFDTIDECVKIPVPDPDARLAALESALNSVFARAKMTLRHFSAKAADYVKQNPVIVITATISVATALATASIIPLGLTGIAFLKDIQRILPRTHLQARPSP